MVSSEGESDKTMKVALSYASDSAALMVALWCVSSCCDRKMLPRLNITEHVCSYAIVVRHLHHINGFRCASIIAEFHKL